MKIKIFQVDAFSNKIFSGNPAAVCPLEKWLDDDILQKIAMENNLSETVFFFKKNETYYIRWFTPTVEVDLCGHATLAAAYVIFNHTKHKEDNINFYSPRSGSLTVKKKGSNIVLNFPTDSLTKVEINDNLANCFDSLPQQIFKGKTDYLFIYDNESIIKNININLDKILELDARGIIISAKGDNVDFVSRFFAPKVGVIEDPVTGSAHTTLIPYWSKLLNKTNLAAKQLSSRKGNISCSYLDDRVEIGGKAKLYLKGKIFLK